ncbi:hypothetical protein B296_00021906 [Ensete ventricosum]|uniref:Uncharacterized protein n=1 Tax=Ensete ventricosum TaxID=4639 RepID=A0A426ZWX4_ENSVE|nr:hypothetical protein B296_00021906 [Ensete ventricosum]
MGQIQYSEKYFDDTYEYRYSSRSLETQFLRKLLQFSFRCLSILAISPPDRSFFECRHVVLPPEVAKLLPKNRLLSEVSNLAPLMLGFHQNHFFPLKTHPSTKIQILIEWVVMGVPERVAGDRGAAEQGMGALRDPPPGTAHHALPAAAQLPTAAGEPGRRRRRSSYRPSSPQVMYYYQQ